MWKLDLKEGIDLALFLNVFEPHVYRAFGALVRPGDTVIDIGANIGAHTLPLARLVGASGTVYAIEPTTYAIEKLEQNIELNASLESSVRPLQIVLTNDTRTDFNSIPSSWPLTGSQADLDPVYQGRSQSTHHAPCMKLDDLVAQVGLEKLDLIKIDVDGNEVEVLEGAKETLGRLKPKIVIECAPHAHHSREGGFEAFLELLRQLPYEATTLDGTGPVELNADEFDEHGGSDVLLLPR